MIEATTDVVLGEGIRVAGEAQRRVYGGGIGLVLFCALTFGIVAALGPWIGLWLRPMVGSWSDLVGLLFLIGAGIGSIMMYGTLHRRGFLRNLKRLGSPGTIATRFVFGESGISVETDRISHSLPWSAVQLIVRVPDYWLLQVDTTTLAIPRRAFANAADEQAFVELTKTKASVAVREHSVFENQ